MKKIIVVLHFANTKRFHVLWPRILSNGYGGDIVNRCAMGQVIYDYAGANIYGHMSVSGMLRLRLP